MVTLHVPTADSDDGADSAAAHDANDDDGDRTSVKVYHDDNGSSSSE